MSINDESPTDSIISIGDAYNHAIFNYEEYDEGLNRLTVNRLIKKTEN